MSVLDFHGVDEDIVGDDDDADDDFFYDSIQRYDTLLMFNLDNEPYQLLPINETTLSVVSKRNNVDKSEILKLKIPSKLALPPEEDGISKENDFEILSGLLTEGLVHQIGKILKHYKLITTEKESSGLQIYTFFDSLLGNREETHTLDIIQWKGSNFSVIEDSNQVICSKCYHKPLVQVDINAGVKIREIKHPSIPAEPQKDTCLINNIQSKALTSNSIAVLNCQSGCVTFHDLRSDTPSGCLTMEKKSDEIWTLSGYDYDESSLNYLGIISNQNSFYIYDKRNNSAVIQNVESKASVVNDRISTLKFNESASRFSMSGRDALVEVYALAEDGFEHIFTHNGHSPKNLPDCFVTDHIWQRTGSREVVISICDNKTLNCWDSKV